MLALAASRRLTPMMQPQANGRPPALGVGGLSWVGRRPPALRRRVSSPLAAAARALLLPPLLKFTSCRCCWSSPLAAAVGARLSPPLELASSCAHVSDSRRPAPPGQLHLLPCRPQLHPAPGRHPSRHDAMEARPIAVASPDVASAMS